MEESKMGSLKLNTAADSRYDWQSSPRISFSQDLDVLSRSSSPRTEVLSRDNGDFSSEFEFMPSLQLDLQLEHGMLSADELFSDGKLRLQEESIHRQQEKEQWRPSGENKDGGVANAIVGRPVLRPVKTFNGNPRSTFTSVDDNNPRCISMSMYSARKHPRQHCRSLTNSRCSSPSRMFSLPPTTPASPKASTSRYPGKLKGFLRSRKAHIFTGREFTETTTCTSVPAVSADISRESPVTSSCRLSLPRRSFWPFSRSNSAGENKSGRKVSPPPRRSNSAGESKTSGSTILPQLERDGSNGDTTDRKAEISQHPRRRSIQPLSNTPTVKRSAESHSVRMCACVAVPSPSQAAPSSSSASSLRTTDTTPRTERPKAKPSPGPLSSCASGGMGEASDGNAEAGTDTTGHRMLYPLSGRQATVMGVRGAGSPARTFSLDDATHYSARRLWDSPGRTRINGPTRSIRNTVGSVGHVRSKETMARDTVDVHISPVLNVPGFMGPRLGGAKAASTKAKLFGLGHVFLKKDRVAGSCGEATPIAGKRNGA